MRRGILAVTLGVVLAAAVGGYDWPPRLVAVGFFAAVFNLPAEGNALARFALFGAATASGALTSRLVIC